ncbi:hypothetical protein LY78DRAFT_187498 [Colletotrichum sublineola]|nr:hypothetical protein LY78DRAFT_187498 [Colletotrichum sublineola]
MLVGSKPSDVGRSPSQLIPDPRWSLSRRQQTKEKNEEPRRKKKIGHARVWWRPPPPPPPASSRTRLVALGPSRLRHWSGWRPVSFGPWLGTAKMLASRDCKVADMSCQTGLLREAVLKSPNPRRPSTRRRTCCERCKLHSPRQVKKTNR